MEKNFCLLSRRAVVYGLINRNLSLPRLWTMYWKQGLTLLPAQEAGQPAVRKQNYIVRTICGEEGNHADQ